MTRRPRSTISLGAHRADAPARQRALGARTRSVTCVPLAARPEQQLGELADRAAPAVRVSCSAHAARTSGTALPTATGSPTTPQHGEVRESRRRRTRASDGAMPWRSSIAQERRELLRVRILRDVVDAELARAQPHALRDAPGDDHDADAGPLQQVDAESVLDVVALELDGARRRRRRDRCRRR